MRVCLLVALAFVSSLSFAGSNDLYSFCSGGSIELKPSPNAIDLKVADPVFDSNEQESGSSVKITNTGERDIIRLLVVIEYLNARSERLVSVGHYYKDDDGTVPADVFANYDGERQFAALANREHLWNIGNGVEGPIRRNGGSKLISGSNTLTVTRCPSSAIVTAIALEYADGDIRTFFPPGWGLDPEPASASVSYGWLKDVSMPADSLHIVRGLFSLVVSPNGCATVSGNDSLPISLALSARHWLMIAGQSDGKTVESKLPLAVVIHSKTGVQRSWDPKGTLPEVMAVLHVQNNDGKGVPIIGIFPIQQVEECGVPPRPPRNDN